MSGRRTWIGYQLTVVPVAAAVSLAVSLMAQPAAVVVAASPGEASPPSLMEVVDPDSRLMVPSDTTATSVDQPPTGVYYQTHSGLLSGRQLGFGYQLFTFDRLRNELSIRDTTTGSVLSNIGSDSAIVGAPVVGGENGEARQELAYVTERGTLTVRPLFDAIAPAVLEHHFEIEAVTAPLIHRHIVVVGFVDGIVRGFDIRDSELIFETQLVSAPATDLTLVGSVGFFVDTSGNLVSIDVSDGRLGCSIPLGQATVAPVAVGEDLVVALSNGLIRTVSAQDCGPSDLVPATLMSAAITSSPAVVDDLVIVPEGSRLVAVDLTDGALAWAVETGGFVSTSVVAAGSVVIVGTAEGTVVAVDTNDGSLVWSVDLGAPVVTDPIVGDGVVFVGDASDTLTALAFDGADSSTSQSTAPAGPTAE